MSGFRPLARPSNAQIEAKALNYYHPQFKSMAEVSKYMEDWKNTTGSFLIRNSFSNPGALTVTVWYQTRTRKASLKHFTIKCYNNRYYLQDEIFTKLEELVRFYATSKDVPNEEGLKGLRLSHPIPNHDYDEIPSDDGYEEFVSRASPPLPPRKGSLASLQNRRLSSGSDHSQTGSDCAFDDEVLLPTKAEKKGLFSAGKGEKRNKSSSDATCKRPLPPPPRMLLKSL